MRALLFMALLCFSHMAVSVNKVMDAEIDALVGPLVEERLIPGYVAFTAKTACCSKSLVGWLMTKQICRQAARCCTS